MKVKEAKEVLENMLENYDMLEYPILSQQEAEAIKTVLEYLEW